MLKVYSFIYTGIKNKTIIIYWMFSLYELVILSKRYGQKYYKLYRHYNRMEAVRENLYSQKALERDFNYFFTNESEDNVFLLPKEGQKIDESNNKTIPRVRFTENSQKNYLTSFAITRVLRLVYDDYVKTKTNKTNTYNKSMILELLQNEKKNSYPFDIYEYFDIINPFHDIKEIEITINKNEEKYIMNISFTKS